MKKTKIKILFIVVGIFVMMALLPTVYVNLRNIFNSDVLDDLKGEIYYTRRVDGTNTLFKSGANLQNEILIYSHIGKGMDNHNSYNDNIIDFYYDLESENLRFIAMNEGNWRLYELKEGESTPNLIDTSVTVKNATSMIETSDYLKKNFEQLSAIQKHGSLYIIEDGEEKCIKKFYGIYDEKFTGYSPIGFSPDGKYLVYHSMEHMTLLGTIFEGVINDSYGNDYIMELRSGKSTRFLNASNIQWITN
jgi:hypothetical protein